MIKAKNEIKCSHIDSVGLLITNTLSIKCLKIMTEQLSMILFIILYKIILKNLCMRCLALNEFQMC